MVKISAILFLLVCAFFVGGLEAKPVTLEDRIRQIGEPARDRMKPWFQRQRMDYPPRHLAMVTVKDEERVLIYAADKPDQWRFIMQYQVAKMSGKAGPKLKEGDMQVPEGVYQVTHFNPASKFWVSLALNYPNSFDRQMAKRDRRTKLGGDIMVHGWWFSEGCVAVGNTAAEDLFVLVKDVGIRNTRVIITPTDFRRDDPERELPTKPKWVAELYENLEDELLKLGTEDVEPDTRLVAYADIAPPPPPKVRKSFLGQLMAALALAPGSTETTGTAADASTTRTTDSSSTGTTVTKPADSATTRATDRSTTGSADTTGTKSALVWEPLL